MRTTSRDRYFSDIRDGVHYAIWRLREYRTLLATHPLQSDANRQADLRHEAMLSGRVRQEWRRYRAAIREKIERDST
jgi:hypothetical protein